MDYLVFILLPILSFILPIVLLTAFGIYLGLYRNAKRKNRQVPDGIPPEKIKNYKKATVTLGIISAIVTAVCVLYMASADYFMTYLVFLILPATFFFFPIILLIFFFIFLGLYLRAKRKNKEVPESIPPEKIKKFKIAAIVFGVTSAVIITMAVGYIGFLYIALTNM